MAGRAGPPHGPSSNPSSHPLGHSYASIMSQSTPSSLPPGPPLPRSVQAALLLRYWPRFVAACRRRYGSTFTLRIASIGTLVYLDDPADIKTVFAGDPTTYHAGEANSLLAGF